jgi:hypothetical protein
MDKARKEFESSGRDRFISLTREMLKHFVSDNFPTKTVLPPPAKYETMEAGAVTMEEVGQVEVATRMRSEWQHANDLFEKNSGKDVEECRQMQESLLSQIAALSLPDSPLDELIDKLGGPSNVAGAHCNDVWAICLRKCCMGKCCMGKCCYANLSRALTHTHSIQK